MKFKKLFISALALLMLFSSVALADTEKDVGCAECNEIAQTGGADYISEEYLAELQSPSPKRASSTLYVSKYYQNDYSNIMQTCGDTIKKSGCALTSVTMAYNYLKGQSKTPAQINSTLGSSACPLMWYQAATKLGMTVYLYKSSGVTDSYLESTIINNVNNGRPVIVGMRLSNGGSHYVLAKGYNTSSDTFYINDPDRTTNYTTLKQFKNAGATFTQIIVYNG